MLIPLCEGARRLVGPVARRRWPRPPGPAEPFRVGLGGLRASEGRRRRGLGLCDVGPRRALGVVDLPARAAASARACSAARSAAAVFAAARSISRLASSRYCADRVSSSAHLASMAANRDAATSAWEDAARNRASSASARCCNESALSRAVAPRRVKLGLFRAARLLQLPNLRLQIRDEPRLARLGLRILQCPLFGQGLGVARGGLWASFRVRAAEIEWACAASSMASRDLCGNQPVCRVRFASMA